MANVTIEHTINCISIMLGDYAQERDDIKSHIKKNQFTKIGLQSDCVEIIIHGRSLSLHFEDNESGALIVDSVDGVQPESLEDLNDKLCAIME